MDYIKISEAIDLVISIPASEATDTVTYEIISSAGVVLASGSLSFVRDEMWKGSYTPSALGVIIFKANDTTLSSKRENVYRVVGAVISPDGVTTSDLTSLAHVREYLKKETADTADDTFIQDLVTRLSAEIEKKCGRTFIAGARTEYYKGNGMDRMVLKNWPVNSVTSIHIDEDRLWASDAAIDTDDITISDRVPGQVILNGDFFDFSYIENVRVIYNAGYATIPYDIEQACIKLCAIEYIESRRIHTKIEGERDLQADKKDIWSFILNTYRAAVA